MTTMESTMVFIARGNVFPDFKMSFWTFAFNFPGSCQYGATAREGRFLKSRFVDCQRALS
jgi:hypothetical protein